MIKQILAVGFIVFLGLTLIAYLFQRQLIYFPTKEKPDRRRYHAQDMQQVSLNTEDGLALNAWYKPAAANLPTILYLHGNAGHIGFRMPLIRMFLNDQIGVLILDYRGYGGNRGRPNEQGLYADGRAAMKYLLEHGVSSQHVVLYGESLGSGVATKIATEYSVCAVVLQSPFSSLVASARFHYPWAFIKPWDQFNSFGRIGLIKAPLLILHGKLDSIVPFADALTLFAKANEPKRFKAFEYRGHNDLWDRDFYKEVLDFIYLFCVK